LLEILDTAAAHTSVRAAAARALGAAKHGGALAALLRLLDDRAAAPGLVEGCCDGLGALGSREAVGPLLRLFDRSSDDMQLTLAVVRALGQIGERETVEPLSHLLGAGALHRLQRGVEPRMFDQSVEACLRDPELPAPIGRRLASALMSSTTAEARPTSLLEFLGGEADRLRIAAAETLAQIGGNTARAALLSALLDDTTGGATADVIAALAEVEGPDSAEALGYLLGDQGQNPMTPWLVVRQLTDHPAGEAVMRRALMQPELGPFTRGALAEGLGQRGAVAALPTLRQLADDQAGDLHLRSQAVQALGLLNDPGTETALIQLIRSSQEDASLRGLAAEHLPDQLSAEGRRFLRDLLRNERPIAALAAGALRTLGRVRDREALPLMLRYIQDETPSVAQAAIAALIDLDDGSVAPMLVRITQHPSADHALRLQAVGALLRIGGEGYRPLLRIYLNQGALPFRLLALEHLVDAGAPDDELLTILADQSWPPALRLLLLDYFAGDTAAAPVLAGILDAEGDDVQIRALAAEALGRLHWDAALSTLIRLAERDETPGALRLRCIAALRAIGGTAAWGSLSRLADDEVQPEPIRASALQAVGPAPGADAH
jgi:HEAT repeat protein